MAGQGQERFEDFLALERYIEDLQAGRVAHPPAALTPDLVRIYRMAMFFHAASTAAADPRPEFIAELQEKLQHMEGRDRPPIQQHPCAAPKGMREHPRVSRRAWLRTGAAVAASLAVGAGIDHALEEQKITAITAANANPPPWLPLVPAAIPTVKHFVTKIDQLGEQPVPFRAGGIVGYLVRNDAERGDPTAGPVIAMSAACTHMGCLVNWESSDRLFRCPCHGGVFSALGMTVATPSTIRYLAPLPRLETIIDPAGDIFVRVPAQISSIHF